MSVSIQKEGAMTFSRVTETGTTCTYVINMENGLATYSDTEGNKHEGAIDADVLSAICQTGAMPYVTYTAVIARIK